MQQVGEMANLNIYDITGRETISPAGEKEAGLISQIISSAFKDVAVRFSLTPENCPRHPSNCTKEWIRSDLARGVEYFILDGTKAALGCVGVEIPEPGLCYIERLSILPDKRQNGRGARLVRHALDHAASKGVLKAGIGIIAEQDELKKWYEGFGFKETAVKQFPHLPFGVCLMELPLPKI